MDAIKECDRTPERGSEEVSSDGRARRLAALSALGTRLLWNRCEFYSNRCDGLLTQSHSSIESKRRALRKQSRREQHRLRQAGSVRGAARLRIHAGLEPEVRCLICIPAPLLLNPHPFGPLRNQMCRARCLIGSTATAPRSHATAVHGRTNEAMGAVRMRRKCAGPPKAHTYNTRLSSCFGRPNCTNIPPPRSWSSHDDMRSK